MCLSSTYTRAFQIFLCVLSWTWTSLGRPDMKLYFSCDVTTCHNNNKAPPKMEENASHTVTAMYELLAFILKITGYVLSHVVCWNCRFLTSQSCMNFYAFCCPHRWNSHWWRRSLWIHTVCQRFKEQKFCHYSSWNIHLSFSPSTKPPLPFPLIIYGNSPTTMSFSAEWLTDGTDHYTTDIGQPLDQGDVNHTLWVGPHWGSMWHLCHAQTLLCLHGESGQKWSLFLVPVPCIKFIRL